MNEKERMHDIDWLRVLGMLSIFVFHCGRYFDTEGWHIKNPQVYRGMDIFIGFLVQWIMPLFFILSAFSAYYAIRARGSSIFIKEEFHFYWEPLYFLYLYRYILSVLPTGSSAALFCSSIPIILKAGMDLAAILPGWDCTCGTCRYY